jgi:hypothetical protein
MFGLLSLPEMEATLTTAPLCHSRMWEIAARQQ